MVVMIIAARLYPLDEQTHRQIVASLQQGAVPATES